MQWLYTEALIFGTVQRFIKVFIYRSYYGFFSSLKFDLVSLDRDQLCSLVRPIPRVELFTYEESQLL